MKNIRWLDRRIAAPGPHMTLCLYEQQYQAALQHLRATTVEPWIRNAQSNATTHWWTSPERQLTAIICLSGWQGRDPIEVAGLLVHEAVHVWQAYAEQIGEDEPSKEMEAYGVQAIAQELMAEFVRQQR